MIVLKHNKIELWQVNEYWIVLSPNKFRKLTEYHHALDYYNQLIGE